MTTVVVGEHDWLTQIIEQRQARGQDLHDEMWDGVYHMAPNASLEHGGVGVRVMIALSAAGMRRGLSPSGPFNLGAPHDFRVPDGGWFDVEPHGTYAATAAAVLEVLSPGDETYAKFDFFVARGVREVLVAHPTQRWIRCYLNTGRALQEATASVLFSITMDQLATMIQWPTEQAPV